LNSFDAKFESLIGKLQVKQNQIVKYRSMLKWRFFQGNAPDACQADFDDSSWENTSLPLIIDARNGDSWLRYTLTVPEKIAGITVSDAKAKLSSSVMLGGSEIYVNSKRVMEAEYWTELRGPRIVLNESVRPGEKYVVALHILPYHEPVSVPVFSLSYSRVEKVAFEIDSFIQELKFLKDLNQSVVRESVEAFSMDFLNKRIEDLVKEIERARKVLSKASKTAKEFKVHLIGHAHIDMNWLWPWKNTVDTVRNTFNTMVNLMERHPDLHFSQSQAVTYRVVEERFPELFGKIKRNVEDGRWEATAAMWVEADLNMGGTEALVRQILHGKRYVKDKFGVETEICWEPDTFGHVWTFPQILRKSGIKYYYFTRCGKGHPLFWWEGPDGSRVLAFTSVYNNVISPGNIVDISRRLYDRYGLKTSMFVYGVGDHGGGPTIEDVEATHEILEKPALPEVSFSSAQEFFKEIESQLSEVSVPVVKDELNYVFDGCYTTHGDIKRYNRLCERLLVDAEKLGIMSGVYPREKLHKAWLNMLFNQFHDILDGSGTHEAYDYPLELAQEAAEIARSSIRAQMKKIAENIGFSRTGVPIVVFNTLSWNRADIVSAKVPGELTPKNPTVISSDGDEAPTQVSGDEVLFVADVPPMGYRTYYLVEGGTELESLVRDSKLENEYLRVELDKNSGGIKSMYDKVNDRYVFKKEEYTATRPEASNLLQVLYEVPHGMSAWIIGEISRVENLVRNASVEFAEDGPVRGTAKVVHKFSNSTITQYIRLYRGIPRLDFRTLIDWKETSDEKTDAPMLKASFTPMLKRSKATFEIPFGYIERPSDGREVPALRWVDLSDGEYGVSLLNDSKYGFDVKGNTIRMTLVRTSYSPDTRPDYGEHEILYSIYPHKGDWKEAQTFRRGYEVNHPLECITVTDPSSGSLPETKSFIQVKPENVVVSCIKKAEDSDDTIIRMYDATGEGAEAELTLGFDAERASEVDLMEEEIARLELKNGKINMSVKPFEIKTIAIRPTN